jgi:hypothetical protein
MVGKYQKMKESKEEDNTYMYIVHVTYAIWQKRRKKEKKRYISESYYSNILFYKIETIRICINK